MFHVNKGIEKAKVAKAKIKELSKTYRLCQVLVQKLQIAAVQLVALYGIGL